MKINNIKDYADYVGVEVEDLERATYKYTDCGAWIRWNDEEMEIGSIVEGSDAEFDRTFKFPTTSEAIDNWFEELEQLVDEAWHEANGD